MYSSAYFCIFIHAIKSEPYSLQGGEVKLAYEINKYTLELIKA